MTYLSELYENFLSKVSEYRFLSKDITIEEVEEELFNYFKTARTKFFKCKSDLQTIKTDADGEKHFTEDLHPFEIEILTSLMVVEYMKPIFINSEVMKQSLSDKDFKIYSQASQLRELTLTYRMLKSECQRMITQYTFLDLDGDGEI